MERRKMEQREDNFYPRPPCGGRRTSSAVMPVRPTFLSTSPLRGTTLDQWQLRHFDKISIHVPLAGDDAVADSSRRSFVCISIHVPLAGDDG